MNNQTDESDDDETLDAVKRHFQKLLNAKSEPSPQCNDGGEHSFTTIAHGDSKEYFSWTYECTKCEEVVTKQTKRTGSDKELWS